MDADPTKKPIRKDRYCLADGNQYFESLIVVEVSLKQIGIVFGCGAVSQDIP